MNFISKGLRMKQNRKLNDALQFIIGHNFQRQTAAQKQRKMDQKALKAAISKQKSRVTKGGLILSTAWIASSYWTFLGYMMTAQETATSSFTGTIKALIAAVVAATVVAGCCALLLGFSGEGDDNHE